MGTETRIQCLLLILEDMIALRGVSLKHGEAGIAWAFRRSKSLQPAELQNLYDPDRTQGSE